jgi:UDP-N-acetylmuramate dehydrogenase
MAKLTLNTSRDGLAGFEVMAGIPGTIGGGIRMNAGGKYGDIGALVTSVDVMDAHGNITTRNKDDLIFSYRACNITAPIILGATLQLEAADATETTRRMKEIWMYKRNSQPLNADSAGCVFKNPDKELSGGRSAGVLIDQAGLKGLSVGGATVSEIHANFFVSKPGCTASDVMELIRIVRQRVAERFGVDLQTEVKLWP